MLRLLVTKVMNRISGLIESLARYGVTLRELLLFRLQRIEKNTSPVLGFNIFV